MVLGGVLLCLGRCCGLCHFQNFGPGSAVIVFRLLCLLDYDPLLDLLLDFEKEILKEIPLRLEGDFLCLFVEVS